MPVSSSFLTDAPSDTDSLGRMPFAKALAHSLPLPEGSEGLVVGIEGDWGSGKSTLIRLIMQELNSTSSGPVPLLIAFNPWMISTTGALVEALISQIAVTIGADETAGEKGVKAGEKLLGYIGIFNKLKYLKYAPGGGWVGNIAEAVAEFADKAGAIKESGENAIKDVKALLPQLDLSKQRARVTEALRDLNRPIIVVVDDIDRLNPLEIQSIMQAIKAIADFPRMTYLLAYDRAIVAAALGKDEVVGVAYLEKIVQVSYPIPPLFNRQRGILADKKIRGFLSSRNISLRIFEEDLWQDGISILSRLLPQPRDVVRLINRLALSIPATYTEINAVDVMVFEALSMKYPKLRDAIHKHSNDFVGSLRDDAVFDDNQRPFSYRPEDAKIEEASWLRHLPSEDDSVKAACKFLFLKNGYGNDYLRLRHPDRLARLFRMTSIEGGPELNEIRSMLQYSTRLNVALAGDATECSVLQDWICHYFDSCNEIDRAGCINVLIQNAKRFEDAGLLSQELLSSYRQTMRMLVGEDSTADGLSKLIVDSAPLAIAESIVSRLYTASRHLKQFDSELNASVFSSFSSRVEEWLANGAIGEGVTIHRILNTWVELPQCELMQAQRTIEGLWISDAWLTEFLSGFSSDPEINRGYVLISDASMLASRILQIPLLASTYTWLLARLQSPQMLERQELTRSLYSR